MPTYRKLPEWPNLHKVLYLIICSRGPGSETIVVRDLLDAVWEDDEGRFEIFGWNDSNGQDIEESQIPALLAAGHVVEGQMDEGPVFLWPTGMSKKDFLQAMIASDLRYREMDEREEVEYQIFVSAMVRAFLVRPGVWTSCGAWRKLDLEFLTKKEFEEYLAVTDQSLETCLAHPCPVIKESAKLYQQGESPAVNRGC
jgi:hypothetical protein